VPNNKILERTLPALGQKLIAEIERYKYCIVGCGGTGALFAEMLARTGAKKITLIDGDTVAASNLNRVISFVRQDVGCPKVNVLEARLKKINDKIEVASIECCLREHDPEDTKGQEVRDAICNADVVVIGIDDNRHRIICEELCRSNDPKKKVVSLGVHVNNDGSATYECSWNPKTSPDKDEEEGYGVGSYASIVIEATAVAFSMLLHHLRNPDSNSFNYFFKSYKHFAPEN